MRRSPQSRLRRVRVKSGRTPQRREPIAQRRPPFAPTAGDERRSTPRGRRSARRGVAASGAISRPQQSAPASSRRFTWCSSSRSYSGEHAAGSGEEIDDEEAPKPVTYILSHFVMATIFVGG